MNGKPGCLAGWTVKRGQQGLRKAVRGKSDAGRWGGERGEEEDGDKGSEEEGRRKRRNWKRRKKMRRKLRRKRRGGRRKVTATRSSSRHCENGCKWGTEGRIPVDQQWIWAELSYQVPWKVTKHRGKWEHDHGSRAIGINFGECEPCFQGLRIVFTLLLWEVVRGC